jgi:hypothetical protein
MLLGAGLSRAWPHDRAHYFFARARWEMDELGLAVARLAVLLVPVGAPLTVAVDDSLFRRAGRKVDRYASRLAAAASPGPRPRPPGRDPQDRPHPSPDTAALCRPPRRR